MQPTHPSPTELRQGARTAFMCALPQEKVQRVRELWTVHESLSLNTSAGFSDNVHPGRPSKPALVLPRDVPRRSPYTPEGHAALIHSITHIEFNAIKMVFNEEKAYGHLFVPIAAPANRPATGERVPSSLIAPSFSTH